MSIAYPCYYIESYDEAMPIWLDYLQFTVDFEYREKESPPSIWASREG